jgi:hypothetical protein
VSSRRQVADTVPVMAGDRTRYDYQVARGTEVTIAEHEAPDALIALA